MTHSDLVQIAYRWCLGPGGAAVAFKELVSLAMERPDVLALGGTVPSIMVECKVSRSDFLADRKKLWRVNPSMGMGSHRIYCAPEGLLRLEELPEQWALLSVALTGRCTLTHRPWAKCPAASFLNSSFCQPRSKENEATVMLSALRRLQKLGVVDQIHREPCPELALADLTV